MNGHNLCLGLPVHYQPTAAFAISIHGLLKRMPEAHPHWLQGDSHPDRARNRIANAFLKTDREWLWFLDADLKFEPAQMARLFEKAVGLNADVMCGFYAKKKLGPADWVGNALTTEKRPDGLYVMKEAATGCLIIHRRVLETIRNAFPEFEYTTDPGGTENEFAFFQSGVYWDHLLGRKRWLSEDWAFSHHARLSGFDILGDPTTIAMHEGTCFYPTEAQPS